MWPPASHRSRSCWPSCGRVPPPPGMAGLRERGPCRRATGPVALGRRCPCSAVQRGSPTSTCGTRSRSSSPPPTTGWRGFTIGALLVHLGRSCPPPGTPWPRPPPSADGGDRGAGRHPGEPGPDPTAGRRFLTGWAPGQAAHRRHRGPDHRAAAAPCPGWRPAIRPRHPGVPVNKTGGRRPARGGGPGPGYRLRVPVGWPRRRPVVGRPPSDGLHEPPFPSPASRVGA